MTIKNNPLVSVVMPAYNAEATLIQSLLSVQDQTMRDWEFFLVDDGSTDRTRCIAEHFSKSDSRVNYVPPSGPRGAGNARQRGVGLATSEFIAFLDADDIWLPEKLEQTLDFMRISGSDWAHTAYRAILKSGKIGRKVSARSSNHPDSLLGENPIAVSSSVVRRSIIPTQTVFYTPIGQDRQLWLPLVRAGHQPEYLDSATTFYRLSLTSLSSNKFMAASVRFKNLKFESPNQFQRIWYFVSYALSAGKKNLLRQIPCRDCEREKDFLEMLEEKARVIKAELKL